jgi:hypothetical protein
MFPHVRSRTLLTSLLLTASTVSAIAQNAPARADYREGVLALRAEIEQEMSDQLTVVALRLQGLGPVSGDEPRFCRSEKRRRHKAVTQVDGHAGISFD